MLLFALVACLTAFGEAHHVARQPTPAAQPLKIQNARRQDAATTTAAPSVTAISECHFHETTQFCMAGTSEFQVLIEATATGELPAEYTGCHNHEDEMFCFGPDGEEVEILPEGAEHDEEEEGEEHDHEEEEEEGEEHDHEEEEEEGEEHDHEEEEANSGEDCHFHNGVEHCVGASSAETTTSCDSPPDRDYDIPLRIGLLFVMLITTALGVLAPILLTSLPAFRGAHPPASLRAATLLVRQFGTGVIVSTAFIHLYTHAQLSFSNPCLEGVEYESTASAILMAGLFLAFVVEWVGRRIVHEREERKIARAGGAGVGEGEGTSESAGKDGDDARNGVPLAASLGHHHYTGPGRTETLNVLVMEAGIIFHSILIGLTVVVTPNSAFATLYAAIIFHQFFEGLALGSRISTLPSPSSLPSPPPLNAPVPVSMLHKLFMALAFAVTTPVGMAIGLGVINSFNGNDPSTIVAIGTLDALSAGVLVWVGVVEMWAGDWIWGEMERAGVVKTAGAGTALIAGLALMSLIGKWA
ncbi:ZIP zinc transporter-domain-containing protein [Lineolata rhizophorae]|uniref:ZIP zinc transporter-domain-containing protein n=1 Tax=Lineolata rhizophorae TaxID=578093 RepID=A0A6A6P6Y2_9PEZI|nr:ZIP zinc transporter-domain-containing protein [Lineolata rhizophorae]